MSEQIGPLAAIEKLREVLLELRAKCPWDKVQTWQTLRHLTLEEVFELNDALLADDPVEVKKELGDVLLHIMFYAMIAEEEGKFSLSDVAESLRLKLIARHPHVYGDAVANDAAAVKENWEKIKLKEGARGVLAGVSKGVPSVIKAHRLGEKAGAVGFDWPDALEVRKKINEELQELDEAKTQAEQEEEMGDLLFTIVNYGRHLDLNPDAALEKANAKFKKRFEWVEAKIEASNLNWSEIEGAELNRFWEMAKASTSVSK